ncbi:hypothetical protein JCM3775_005192 [Rhodotorula graminis]
MPALVLPPAYFDARKHLCYRRPDKVISMAELALDGGISPVGVTAPFPLFSREAVTELRREILSEEVLDKYTVSSYISAFQGREYPQHVAPFVHAAWTSPEVLAAVSDAAGIDLVPVMDLELGHVNYQLAQPGRDGFLNTPHEPWAQPSAPEDQRRRAQELADADKGEGATNVMFHHDSYPFVCVLMLSDCENMIGGETALRTGDGRIVKARGPSVGSCVVMQGRHISHAALRAYGVGERITMVTSFRARDPMVHDGSVLSTIHPVSKANRLNYQWSMYRLKLLSERFAVMASQLEKKKELLPADDDDDGRGGSEVVNVEEMSQWIDEQVSYLANTKMQLMQ